MSMGETILSVFSGVVGGMLCCAVLPAVGLFGLVLVVWFFDRIVIGDPMNRR